MTTARYSSAGSRRRIGWVAVAALCCPAVAGAQGRPLTLRFGWTAGTTARVETHLTMVQQNPMAGGDTLRISTRHIMRVEGAPRGLLVRFTDFEFPDSPAGDPNIAAMTAGQEARPDLLVGFDGHLLDLLNLETVLARQLAMLTEAMTGLPTEFAIDSAMVAAQLASIRERGQQEWNTLVETWVGRTLRPREVLDTTVVQPLSIPMVQAPMMVPARRRMRLVSRGACEGGRGECATLELVITPDPLAMQDAMGKIMGDLLNRAGAPLDIDAPKVDILEEETVSTTILEAGTMLPRRVETVTRMKGSISMQGMTMDIGMHMVNRSLFVY